MVNQELRDMLDKHFQNLSFLARLAPFPNLDQAGWSQFRDWLTEAGANFELDQNAIASLMETQFRSFTTGRGPGMVAVLGMERTISLVDLCLELSEGKSSRIVSDKTKEPIGGTEGRGCQQFAADIVTFAVTGSTEYIQKLNRRAWKGHLKAKRGDQLAIEWINNKFTGLIEPTKLIASISPEAVWPVWLFLTGRDWE